MAFHQNLRRLRIAKGLTQEQLALECGWKGQSRIANYEADPSRKGARKPDIDGVPIIAKALGVDIGELFGFGAGASQPARPDRGTLALAIEVLQRVVEVQFEDTGALADPDAILVAYDEISREPGQVDMAGASRRIAAKLRGMYRDGKLDRGGHSNTG